MTSGTDRRRRNRDRRQYNRTYYLKNQEKFRQAAKDWARANPDRVRSQNQNKAAIREFLIRGMKLEGCVDCGETDPIVLDFDHLPERGPKLFNAATGWRTITAILNEISKCEVRCANCHRRATVARRAA